MENRRRGGIKAAVLEIRTVNTDLKECFCIELQLLEAFSGDFEKSGLYPSLTELALCQIQVELVFEYFIYIAAYFMNTILTSYILQR